MNIQSNYRIDLIYILIIFIAVLTSTVFHELAHWSMGEILGYEMTASLNGTSLITGEFLYEWEKNLVTIAGPLFTVLQAILLYFLLKKYKSIEFYPFLLFPFVMRFAAGLANFLGPNDEGRLGLSFGIGLLTISIIVCSFLFILVYKTSKELKISLKFNVISFFLCFFVLVLLTFIDAKYKIKIA